MKARKLGVIFGVLFLCGVCFGGNLVGKKAPEITVREWITGEPLETKDLAGRVYVVEFWAMWCKPCVENISHLNKLSNKYRELGVEFVALSEDKSAEEVRRFVREKGIKYRVAIDNGTADWFGVRGYPTMVVVNHRGKVAWEGYPWDSKFEKAIAEAVKAGPPPLLVGVDLGPFNHLRKRLFGGNGFAKAYRELESKAAGHKQSASSRVAEEIVETIDKRICERIEEAEGLRTTDPLRARDIYAQIIAKYDGIEAVERAKASYIELKKAHWDDKAFARNRNI